ncbi:Na+/H+-dicarboxylate symporter [Desulfobaculum xiamenense]|uniref:Na+/H+-dicarboxylate symporter n=1 Tax=Desulfobaculum xiamenense TaxID=995050 RepID=A0A846QJU4_9BACT|nr:dicarboxylate/amino acid:cation symporter [Desulfobaculum xiamenense]NJB68411.1 Na+/H+-dicarboxylate symporter [Desulfobaculum xiamenense]
MKLYHKIVIGLALGLGAGLVFGENATVLKPIGDIFIRCLKLIVMPLILATLINGVASAGDIRKVGRVGMKTLIYFMVTTAIAVGLGLLVANVMHPGLGLTLGKVEAVTRHEPVTVAQMLVNMVPTNPIDALAEGRALQVIVFALLFGAALSLTGEKGEPIRRFFESLAEVMLKLTDIVINMAPVGVFALIAWTAGKYGADILLPMLKVILAVAITSALHILFSYSAIVALVARISPLDFMKKALEPALVAISTCSSAAAFPFSMRAQRQLGVPEKISGFTLPLALTINMDGTALYQAVGAIFVADAFGMHLSLMQQATVVLTAVLASVGTAGIPGSGLVMLTLVLESVGLPLEGIAIMAGIDRVLDMFRTVTNVVGDNTSGVVVAALEGELDREMCRTPLDQLEDAEPATANA